MMLVNVEPKSFNQNSVLFKVISMVGIQQNLKSGNTINDWNPFGSTDWWEYANNLGKCNGYVGTGDAAVQIAQKINTRIAQELEAEEQAGHYDIYFTNITSSSGQYGYSWPNNNDSDPYDHLYTYLIFWDFETIYPGYHGCLSPAEMNFHSNGTWQVMNTPTSQGGPKPGNKYPVSAFLQGESVVFYPYICHGHGAFFSYGKKWKMPWLEPGLSRIQPL